MCKNKSNTTSITLKKVEILIITMCVQYNTILYYESGSFGFSRPELATAAAAAALAERTAGGGFERRTECAVAAATVIRIKGATVTVRGYIPG